MMILHNKYFWTASNNKRKGKHKWLMNEAISII